MQLLSFEQGPIRPPSEAYSLLLRFTRNCSWNQCLFCPVYKKRTFSRRTTEEVKKDIDTVKAIVQEAIKISTEMGFSGQITGQVAQHFFNLELPQSYLSVIAWLYHGSGSVFIQDANNLILGSEQLIELLEYLHKNINGITRVTSYARSQTAARKSRQELEDICKAGLNRIHIGLESGCNQVLSFMKKGVTAKAHIDAGKKIKQAGMELSEYWMPGLGGKAMWRQHAVDSAKTLNEINPDFIRLRTLRVPESIPLHQKVLSGEFQLQTDDEIVQEIRLFISELEGINSFVASDHIMNLLQDVEGYLPRDKDFMLEALDRYLNLDTEQRIHYRLGRRMGHYHGVADMERLELATKVEETLEKIRTQYGDGVDDLLNDLANRMI